MNHIRPQAAATADLRDAARLELAGGFQAGAFDGFAHTAEMRRIADARRGRYNIPNVGIFLWRVQALRLAALAARRRRRRRACASASTRSATDKPLFATPRTEDEITHLAEPLDVPLPLAAPLRGGAPRRALRRRPVAAARDRDAARRPIADRRRATSASATSPTIRAAPGTWAHEPQPGDTHVAIDPVLGRVAFAAAAAAGETRLATFHYGSALAVGGGGYDRVELARAARHGRAGRSGGDPLGPPLASVAGRRRGADPRQPPLRRARDDHRDDAGRRARRPVARRPRREPRAAAARRAATSSGSRWIPTRPSCSNGLLLAGAPLVIEEAGRHRRRARSSSATARSCRG